MKKVLIITYYWPPSGGAGVQRWLKFVKYLRVFGWEPVVYTPENPESPAMDDSLLKDIPKGLTVIKTPIWEPYNLYKGFIGQRKGEKINAGFLTEKKKPGLAEKISVWIRGNWFIPDARKFWIKPSVNFLSEYLSNNPVDAIVSTGPPHSMHLIALALRKKFNIKWLADFRDPWTNIDFYDKLLLTKSSDHKHKKLEHEVLKNADAVLTVGWHMADSFKKIVNRKYEVITNGFDEDDFQTSPHLTPALSKGEGGIPEERGVFSISHIGAMNADRNPKMLWAALNELLTENDGLKKDLKINFIGKTDYSVLNDLNKWQLSPYVTKTEYLPHTKTTKAMQSSQVLLLALNNTPNTLGVISGKLFEYIAAKRPILSIGKENGDAARIIKETGAGTICDFEDKTKIKTEISRFYELFKQKKLSITLADTSAYSRRNQTEALAGILNHLTEKK
ncbi:MAG: glycosyl transferase family 1 [Bacteroidetes bacterium]|nr:MAG: glycosyl transferase family 1 [Bacteroidota bacterium]